MCYDERHFDTAKELVDFIESNESESFRTAGKFEATTVGRGLHIFRGQSDSTWEIVPAVFRNLTAPPHPLSDFAAQLPGIYEKTTDKHQWLQSQLHAELWSVSEFLNTADKLGITTPINYFQTIKAIDSNIYGDKEENSQQDFPPIAIIEGIALAQHHGIPTRLIDWTESPLIACFFAAYGASNLVSDGKRENSANIAIFCFNVVTLSRSNKIVQVEAARHRNNFLRQQKGLFTYIPTANSYFIKNGSWPSLEDIICEENSSGSLKKYTLPSSQADELLRILFDYDITKHHLMPTLDNIAHSHRYIKKLWPQF
ncbi:MAG: FRG domain-containing protein [Methylobacter tundripaludum]|uniref:FRG domain-containing protein n=1 Tax=Methylobacter tundripaludum TaxID=173365 RepID=A0A2S6GTU4_9GAMM|nr:FRG domain-containing protein [Methylobacter tundripaludum]MCF7966125.1 FRG domain-containing protein [Methylobacter tundripaludum]MCK9635550.1 FRG domain-containing protein [Methylobacter tundripaludum]PPK68607.1 FRG domain-containing protein [Methylobacter tundripaludum]